jgi:hypothetical protein
MLLVEIFNLQKKLVFFIALLMFGGLSNFAHFHPARTAMAYARGVRAPTLPTWQYIARG